jgi:DNA-binding XRE family transcriptional regulator
MKPLITGNMIRAARALAGINQDALAKAADLPIQTLSRMEASGAKPIVSRDSTTVAVLAALGRHGVMMQPRGVALVQESQSPNVKSISSGPADVQRVHPATANQVFMR